MRDWVDGWKVSGEGKEIPDKEKLLTKSAKDLPMHSPQQKKVRWHCFI